MTDPIATVERPASETGPLRTLHVTDPKPAPEWADTGDTTGEWTVRMRPRELRSPVDPVAAGGVRSLSTRALLANVVGTQALFAGLVLAAIWWAGVPADALGLAPLGGVAAAWLGGWLGLALWGTSEIGSWIARRFGVDPATGLRELLSPDTRGEWVGLLLVVLPIVAGFEELLFRGVLIGAMHAGFGVPPWLLVVGSSLAFAAGHSAQGRLGVVVTGALGLALGGAFAVTGSLLVVVLAHYVVNAAEFLVHET